MTAPSPVTGATPDLGAGLRRLAGRVAIITGGATGIGLAAADRFAREGAAVVIAGRRREAGEAAAARLRAQGADARFVAADVAREDDIDGLVASALDHHGRVDVLYANAGTLVTGTALETDPATWRHVIDVNLTGQYLLARAGIPALREAGGGAIIFTASELGLVGASECVAYCAAKGAVVNMTRAMAIDCAPNGIRVNCIAPGPVRTAMIDGFFAAGKDPAALERRQTDPVLLRRIAAPEEIAACAVHLASDDASYMTGAVMVVDGGATAWYGL
jgi:NAD(P)-dependent dehydrogenase (short-subunit alcohol dehydrogenase family)